MCRAFDTDLPILSTLMNISSFCAFAKRLKRVNIPSYFNFLAIDDASYLFYASGVEKVTGLKNLLATVSTSSNMFDSCGDLVDVDFKFPYVTYRGTWAKQFYGCSKLAKPTSELFYPGISSNFDLDVKQLFNGCVSLPAEDLAPIFWGNPNIRWTNTAEAFSGCSDELRALVPESWGGTATDVYSATSYDERIKELERRVTALEGKEPLSQTTI